MPYSERAQTEDARQLQQDENGYFDLEWRPVEDILAELVGKGVDISGFDAAVEKRKENLIPEIKKGLIAVNDLDEESRHLAIFGYLLLLPPGSGIETKRKVYYGDEVKARGLIE